MRNYLRLSDVVIDAVRRVCSLIRDIMAQHAAVLSLFQRRYISDLRVVRIYFALTHHVHRSG